MKIGTLLFGCFSIVLLNSCAGGISQDIGMGIIGETKESQTKRSGKSELLQSMKRRGLKSSDVECKDGLDKIEEKSDCDRGLISGLFLERNWKGL